MLFTPENVRKRFNIGDDEPDDDDGDENYDALPSLDKTLRTSDSRSNLVPSGGKVPSGELYILVPFPCSELLTFVGCIAKS